MLVLGLDPGLAITGYGLVRESPDRTLSSLEYGTIATPAQQPLPARLLSIDQQLEQLLAHYRPDAVAVEELFFCRNVTTALVVGQARGVVILGAARHGLPVFEYKPMEIKQAISGYGKASKSQVQEMVRLLLDLAEVPQPDDAADGLAVAICHLHSARLHDIVGPGAS
ncbi:MAG: crossover junction endodeoxyribonuclease RuvC [Anaerolineae bacterium]|nr:crossover junction endodeoxyribonuclease RuvC [Anaerolineae bacterium]